MKLWGVDLGGTKIECAVLDAGKTIVRRRMPSESEKGYPHIILQIKKLIDEIADDLGERPKKIGFATPGTLDPETETMKNCNTVSMNGQPMRADLENLLQTPVTLANDANCFALAETMMGAGKDKPNLEVIFGVIMGTGVGGGLVVNGRLINGHHGITGEWGHNVIEEFGEDCYCGKRGCVETVISGVYLESHYARLSGHKLKLKQILKNHLAGIDPHASATIERLIEYYGRAISTLINVMDPDMIIIGGGVGNIDLLYTEGFERIKKYVLNDKVTTTICKPVLGDSAGVFGAALLEQGPGLQMERFEKALRR